MINLDEKNLPEKNQTKPKKKRQNRWGRLKPLLLKQIRTASSFLRFFSLYEYFILYS